MAQITNPRLITGGLAEAVKGADVFIGVSVPGALTKEMVATMAPDSAVFAMANPVPEIMPEEARAGGAKMCIRDRPRAATASAGPPRTAYSSPQPRAAGMRPWKSSGNFPKETGFLTK